MSNPESPFDSTLWDPVHPELAIEDPFDGSEAMMRMLDTPPMPMDDGGYWVFGASSFVRTCTFDRTGKPYIKHEIYNNPLESVILAQKMSAWFEQLETGVLPEGYPENPSEFFDFTATPYHL